MAKARHQFFPPLVNGDSAFFFFLRFYPLIFLERGQGREKERERNINVSLHPLLGTWPATQACVLTSNGTGDPSFHRQALNPLSHTSQGGTLLFDRSEEHYCFPYPHSQGKKSFLNKVWIQPYIKLDLIEGPGSYLSFCRMHFEPNHTSFLPENLPKEVTGQTMQRLST